VSAELHQSFTFVSMDLAAARIAYDIIFDDSANRQSQIESHSPGQSQSDLSRVIIHIGAFHTMCAYMGALGHMLAGSGFEEVLIEADICASGSIEKVLSGKHFNHAVRVHQRMLEADEQLLWEDFAQTQLQGCNEDTRQTLSNLASNPNAPSYAEAVASPEVIDLLNDFHQFRINAASGKMGLTAKLWTNYCDSVCTLLRFQRAVKKNDLDLFISSLRDMPPLLFAADRQNYARYLSLYYSQLLNLQHSCPEAVDLLRCGGLSVARSTNPGCRIATDITIEQTGHRAAKMQGGVIGITRRPSAYLPMVSDQKQESRIP